MPSRASEDFKAVPALSVKGGRPVIVKGRKVYDPLEDEDGAPIMPVEFVEELSKRFGSVLYLNDIDGIQDNAPQYPIIKEMSDIVELWVDAGSRSPEGLMDVLVAGAHRAVLSTKTMGGLRDIDEAVEVSEQVMLCVDVDKGLVAGCRELAHMTPRSVTEMAHRAGIRDVVLADHGRRKDGALDLRTIQDLVRVGVDLFVGGRVVVEDLEVLRTAGAKGALLDMKAIIRRW